MSPRSEPAGVLTARVLLGTSRVELKVPGERAVSFDEQTLSKFFRVGLLVGRGADWDAVPVGELRAKGDVAFLVGRVDIGIQAGLAAVSHGLAVHLDKAIHDLKEPWTATPAKAEQPEDPKAAPVEDSVAAYKAALGQPPVWPPLTTVSVDDLQADFDTWLARVEQGTTLTLTGDGGRPVAALVPWEWFRSQRERLARIEFAYWMAWANGRFDARRFADVADEQITPPGELSTKPLPDDEDDADAPDAG